VAHGRIVHGGRRIAVANTELFDADGKAVAVATGSAMVLPGRPASLAAPDEA
jgi:acyl-coenzyme A thioesterase PaaI-like protein